MIKALYYVVGGLALIGLIAHRRQIFAPDLACGYCSCLVPESGSAPSTSRRGSDMSPNGTRCFSS